MHKCSKASLAVAALLLALLVAAPAVQGRAYAENGSDDSSSSSGISSSGTATDTETEVEAGDGSVAAPASGDDNGMDTNDPQELRQLARQKAEDARKRAQDLADQARQRVADAQQKAGQQSGEDAKTAARKLAAGKLRICQGRQKAIENIMGRIGKRGTNNLQLIDTISQRVQQFYTDKNLNITNYDALLASVNTARTAAQSAATSVDGTQAQFSCDGNDPQGTAKSFTSLVQARNDAIKAYRDAVKQLVEAVRAAAKAAGAAKQGSVTNNGSASSAAGTEVQ